MPSGRGFAAGDALADGIDAGERRGRERLADHHDLQGAAPVAVLNRAPAENGDAHRFDVAGRDDSQPAQDRVAWFERPSFRHEAVPVAAGPHRDLRRHRRILDARNLSSGLRDPLERLHDASSVRVFGRGQRQPRAHDALRIESRLDALKRNGAANEQARADEQHEGDRQLADDEAGAQPVAHAAHRGATSAFLEDRLHIGARRPDRGGEAEENGARQRDEQREPQHDRVERRLLEARHAIRRSRDEGLDAPGGEREPRGGGDQREDEALGQELPDHPAAAGAERGANRHLPGPRGPAREQQVGDVAARDQQDEADRPEQDEEPLPVVADELLHHRDDGKAQLRIVLREALTEILGER